MLPCSKTANVHTTPLSSSWSATGRDGWGFSCPWQSMTRVQGTRIFLCSTRSCKLLQLNVLSKTNNEILIHFLYRENFEKKILPICFKIYRLAENKKYWKGYLYAYLRRIVLKILNHHDFIVIWFKTMPFYQYFKVRQHHILQRTTSDSYLWERG